MDKDTAESFVVETFFNGADFEVGKMADFLILSENEKNQMIKIWANDKILVLNNKKSNLDNIKVASEQQIDAEIIKLQSV